jgi:hypothetical protein
MVKSSAEPSSITASLSTCNKTLAIAVVSVHVGAVLALYSNEIFL